MRAGDSIDPSLERIDDVDGRLDIDDVRSEAMRRRFARSDRLPTRCRWYRLRLSNQAERFGPWVLTADTDVATLYEPTAAGYRAESFGLLTPVASRRLQDGESAVDIVPSDYDRDLYIRLDGKPTPALSFLTAEAMVRTVESFDMVGICFLSVYTVLTLAAFFFAAATRAKSFAYYGLYISSQAAFQLSELPLAARSFWPHHAVILVLADTTLIFILITAYYQFLRHAFETRNSRRLDGLMIGSAAVSTVAACYCLISDDFFGTVLQKQILPFVICASFVVPCIVAYLRWRQRFVSAGFFLVGLVVMIAGFLLEPFVSFDAQNVGFTIEAFCFLAALAVRLVAMTNERQRALVEIVSAREATTAEFAKRMAAAEVFNDAFSRFVPREFLRELGRNDVREVVLGDHVEREMTVMFCDIRSFVSLSEDMTPDAMFRFLNVYFGKIGPIVRKHGGFIDKYLGDGVMALFSGPTDGALQASIELHAEVRRLNEQRARNGERPVQIGVGLHRGATILATIGERERYDTTVVADVVNLASRLEGLTGVYGAQIIASEAVLTASLDRATFNTRWLGEVIVQGSTAALSAFEICDGDPAELLLHKRQSAVAFGEALAAYRRGDYSTSRMRFDEVVARDADDRVATYFSERSRQRSALVDAAWDGIERPTKR